MKIFISDLHLGSPLFKSKDKLIALFNNPAVKEIYILGDVFDTWEGKLKNIIKKNKELINFINNCDKVVVILWGNHDPSLDKLKKIFNNRYVVKEFEMELFGKNTLLVHGDKGDGIQIFGKIMFPFYFILERFRINLKAWARNLWHSFLMWKNNKKYNSLVLNMEKKIVDLYKDKCDVLIAGHTHVAKVVDLPGVKYINSGCIIHEPTYIAVDKNIFSVKRL